MSRMKTGVLVFLISAVTLFGCASKEEKKRSYLEKGKAYVEKGDYGSAKIEFKNAIQIDPKYIDALVNLGETLLKLGDFYGAFRIYSQLAELKPDNVDAHFKLATFYLLAKDYDKAHLRCDQQMEKIADVPVVLAGIQNLKGEIFLAQGKNSDAVIWFKKPSIWMINSMVRQKPDPYCLSYLT